ncbi:(deoxy)nucleoside triphosphate pyrophosphohydrolase [Erythrobacteraceae bacterium E2-1 Yellow Sea]|nr:(deoxy)nucleoside triphosphate pyrophosphohydrolase [Erythrobacteraceae bacterium E2-1 Yellow Sea]
MKDVAAAIAIRDQRVLITRRAPGQNLEGLWEFPGGKIEPGETVHQCIERELAEELGIDVRAGEVLIESAYHYEGGAINLIGVEVDIIGGEFELTVHDAYQWVEPMALRELDLAPADVPLAEEVIRRHG